MVLQSWLANWRQSAGRFLTKLRGPRPVRRTLNSVASLEALESRCLLTTSAIELGALPPGGVTLYGVDAADFSGRSVSGIGDVNGDGYDDVLIGALNAKGAGNATAAAGEAYVVFGKADWSGTPTLELSTLDGTNGFVLYGVDSYDYTGFAVSGAGDVNGDGYNDLVIGAYLADGSSNGKSNSGETYVVFGKSSWVATPSVNLGSLNGTNGFTLLGADASDLSGKAVAAAGDVNGDGYDDILVGAPGASGASNAKSGAGETYLVFGKADWSSTATLSLGALNGTNGFTLYGVDVDDGSGSAVASAGDFNGDGFADIIIGAADANGASNALDSAGDSYIVFGKASWSSTSTVTLGALNGTTGFTLYGVGLGDRAGSSVGGAGDVNGDGFDDVIIGAPAGSGISNLEETSLAGEAYVVFGKASWSGTSSLSLGALTGTNGFIFYGVNATDSVGKTVNIIGDVNGDGFDDVLISALFATGSTPELDDAGQSYVIYGKSDWSATATLLASDLDGSNGFTVFGADALDVSGYWATGAGDFNGDGFVDLLIGASGGAGPLNNAGSTGEAYVVFGGNFTASATQVGQGTGETLTGTGAVDKLVGGGGNDHLLGGGGADVLLGGQGDDTLTVTDMSFVRVDGGNGSDTLKLSGSGLNLDLTALAGKKVRNIEVIDIRGSGPNTLTLDALAVRNLTQNSNPSHSANTLRIRRDGNDTVTMGSGWTQGADQVVEGLTYQVFTQGSANVLLEVLGQVLPGVTLSINNSTMAEAAGTATITATLADVAAVDTTISLAFSGSATFPTDYSRTATQIVIPAGSLSASITLTAVQDIIVEASESISVSISSVSTGLEFLTDAVTAQIIDDDNHAPSFTTTGTPSIPENTTAVLTVIATDTDLPAQTVTYSISGGADRNLFSITSGGVLTFKAAPDYEAPGDVGANNVYDVQVTANDGFGGVSTQTLSVTVTNLDDVPTADLDLGGPQTITWIKKQPAITVLPQLVVTSSGNLAGSVLTITMNARGSKKKSADLLSIPSSSSLGSSTALTYANGRLTQVITLNANATAGGIQTFLRGIRFSTKGAGLSTATRRLDVTLAINGGASETVSQTINVVKKVPRAR